MRLQLHQLMRWLSVFGIFSALSFSAIANTKAFNDSQLRASFSAFYKGELGSVTPCKAEQLYEIKVCSSALRNEGNSPYIFIPPQPKATVVLFHGLSDSPFYFRSIAEHLFRQGYLVIVPLTPGHGKLEADADMQDPQLKERWLAHVSEVIALAHTTHEQVFIGGFSTGGALAAHHLLNHPDSAQGLLLFSGALRLTSTAESMAGIWGMKTIAAWLDGKYVTDGPNPFKYPKVASYSALVLMDVIKEVRVLLKDNTVAKPIFAAHSLADLTTLYEGVENLLNTMPGDHTEFKIDESFGVCHADLVLSSTQMMGLNFDDSQVNPLELCATPSANPLHRSMLQVLDNYMQQHTRSLN
jgi:pimeloyl-ACP methyl ester carboxylesterase